MLKGEVKESPRQEFVYFDDDGNLVAYRDTASSTPLMSSSRRAWRSGATR